MTTGARGTHGTRGGDDDHLAQVERALRDALAGEASGVPAVDGPIELVLGRSAARTRRQRSVVGVGVVALMAGSVGAIAWTGRAGEEGLVTRPPAASPASADGAGTSPPSSLTVDPAVDPLQVRLGSSLSDATLDYVVDHTTPSSPGSPGSPGPTTPGTAATGPTAITWGLEQLAGKGRPPGAGRSYRADPTDPASAWFGIDTYSLGSPAPSTAGRPPATPPGVDPAALLRGTGWFEPRAGDVDRLVFQRADGSSGAVIAVGVDRPSMTSIADSLALDTDQRFAPVPVPAGFTSEPDGTQAVAPVTSLAVYTTRRGTVGVAVVQGDGATLADVVRAILPSAARVVPVEVRGHRAVLLSTRSEPGTYSVWWHAPELGVLVHVRVAGPEQLAIDAASRVKQIDADTWATMIASRPRR